MWKGLSSLGGVLWRAIGHRVPFITTLALTLVPLAFNGVAAAAGAPLIPNVAMWSGMVFLLAVLLFVLLRTAELEREIEPKMRFADQVEAIATTVGGENGTTLRIRIENASAVLLDDCFVAIDELINPDGTRNELMPLGLSTQNQAIEQRQGGPFKLRGFQFKYVLIASLAGRDDSKIVVHYESSKLPNVLDRADIERPYELKLRATSKGKPVDKRFRLYVVGNKLMMAPRP